jgi:putative ABC transport system permease protein
VLTLPNAELGGQGVDVIGVDPKTFARAAFWDSSFSGESLQKLLSRISGTDDPGAPLPVIVAGNGAASVTGTLRLSDFGLFTAPIAVNVVDTAKEFPGQNGNAPLVVTSTSLLQKFGVPGLVQLWSTQPDQQVLASVERAGETPTILVTLSDVLDQTTFAAIAWTFDYLQALGVLSGAVIIGGLLLFVSTRARSRALAYVLSRRMGLRRSTHFLSLLTELAFLIGPGAVLGGAVGWTAVELAQPHLNPLPALNPPPLIEVPWPTVAAAVVTALVVWASISGWAQHVADGSRASELLRADD